MLNSVCPFLRHVVHHFSLVSLGFLTDVMELTTNLLSGQLPDELASMPNLRKSLCNTIPHGFCASHVVDKKKQDGLKPAVPILWEPFQLACASMLLDSRQSSSTAIKWFVPVAPPAAI